MRKLAVLTAVVAMGVPFCGCGPSADGPAASAGAARPAETGAPEVRARVIEPGEVVPDPAIGPAEPRTHELYRLRTGDVIEIGIWGEEDMTKQVTVGPDGRISYFLATETIASGRTLSELKLGLATELRKQYKDPQVFVSLVNSAGNFVSVTGVVRNPGLIRISNETRLVEAIAMSGGIPLGSTQYGEQFTEVADLSQAFVLRGEQFLPVNFEVLFGKKTAGARDIAVNNVLLQPNDRIYVPPAVSINNKVFVVGAVRVPHVIHYSKEITFLEAVLRAGDVPEQAWERRSFIVRGRMNNPTIIPVNARQVRTGKVPDIVLQAGDVVFVPKTPLAKAAEVIGQLDTVFQGVTSAEAAYKVRFDRN